MNIANLTNERLIKLDIKAKNQIDAIEQIAKLLKQEDKIECHSEFVKNIMIREKESTTGFGNGIAIPHCKIDSVKQASIAIGKLKKSVEWEALDEKPVDFVVMLAIPNNEASTTHLKVLSTLATKLMEQEFVDNLLNASSEKEIIEVLK
ncbi:PTS sugar transporter subunit IIA [Clostridiaceae bacterium M8S5]|nr:PTS sugar transporter subunit IIA [Clostridiaceae bacterium M8S5]